MIKLEVQFLVIYFQLLLPFVPEYFSARRRVSRHALSSANVTVKSSALTITTGPKYWTSNSVDG